MNAAVALPVRHGSPGVAVGLEPRPGRLFKGIDDRADLRVGGSVVGCPGNHARRVLVLERQRVGHHGHLMGIPPEDLHALARLPGRIPRPEEVVGRRPGRARSAGQELNVHRGRGSRRAPRSRGAPGPPTGAPDPTASALRSAPSRATRHAPPRGRGSSPTRRVQRPSCAVAVGGVRGGTAPRQPLPGTREAWPQRVGWLPGISGVRQARPPHPRTLRLNAPHRPLRRARVPRAPARPSGTPCPAAAHQSPAGSPANLLFERDAALRGGVLEAVEPKPCRELGAGEHAAMQARQGDPLGPSARQVEPLQRPLAPLRWAGMLRPSSSPWRNGEEPFGRKSTRRKPPKCPYCP